MFLPRLSGLPPGAIIGVQNDPFWSTRHSPRHLADIQSNYMYLHTSRQVGRGYWYSKNVYKVNWTLHFYFPAGSIVNFYLLARVGNESHAPLLHPRRPDKGWKSKCQDFASFVWTSCVRVSIIPASSVNIVHADQIHICECRRGRVYRTRRRRSSSSCAGQTSKGVTSTAQRSSSLLNATSTHSDNLYVHVSKLNNALYWLP